MSTPAWITDRAPTAADLDIEGMIQIPAQPSDLASSSGRSVELACWTAGIPWRHTKRRRAYQSKQLQLAATAEACGTCRFYRNGECRRHAPAVGWPGSWPQPMGNDWCGEWEGA